MRLERRERARGMANGAANALVQAGVTLWASLSPAIAGGGERPAAL